MNVSDAVRMWKEIALHLQMEGNGTVITYKKGNLIRTLTYLPNEDKTVWEDLGPDSVSLGRYEWVGFKQAAWIWEDKVTLDFENAGGRTRVLLQRDKGPEVLEVTAGLVAPSREGIVS